MQHPLRRAALLATLALALPALADCNRGGGAHQSAQPSTPGSITPGPSSTAGSTPANPTRTGSAARRTTAYSHISTAGSAGRTAKPASSNAKPASSSDSGATRPTKLTIGWRAKLDGAVYGRPVVEGNHIVVGTENDSLYGLDPRTGKVQWHVRVGSPVPRSQLPCGNIDPLGITGGPAFDPATGLVFAVAEITGGKHILVGVDPTTGQDKFHRDVPTPGGNDVYLQQRPDLLVTNGHVYFTFGGLEGDCGPYRGSVVGVPTSGNGPILSWMVPTPREGGIWATAGPVLTSDGQHLLVSVGNGATTSASNGYDGSDSVTELDLQLHRTAYFAPSHWADDNAADADLGSMSVALLANGKVLIAGKRGVAYLLDASHLGGIGGQLASRQLCRGFGAPAVSGNSAVLPCSSGGPAAVRVSGDTMQLLWRGPANANGSPVWTGEVIWVASYSDRVLYALNADGHTTAKVSLPAALPHFARPTPIGSPTGSAVLLPTLDGLLRINAEQWNTAAPRPGAWARVAARRSAATVTR